MTKNRPFLPIFRLNHCFFKHFAHFECIFKPEVQVQLIVESYIEVPIKKSNGFYEWMCNISLTYVSQGILIIVLIFRENDWFSKSINLLLKHSVVISKKIRSRLFSKNSVKVFFHYELISRKFFEVGVNFRNFHTVSRYH